MCSLETDVSTDDWQKLSERGGGGGKRGIYPQKTFGNKCPFYHTLNLRDLKVCVKCLGARYSIEIGGRTPTRV